ncbi:MAG: helix-turn-helix domain-containing protein [Ruminococcaceae bacterium]|nr:helix-turn-helix domain-containing protein [Oscillospiraceae bacterium]
MPPEMNTEEKLAKHFSSLLGVDVHRFDVTTREFTDYDNTFCSRCPQKCDHKTTHLYGCYEAARWDRKYIYYCRMDFIFIAVPVIEEYDVVTGGLIAGPVLMGALEDYPETYGLPHMETSRVNDMAEIASAVFTTDSTQKSSEDTAQFLNTLYIELESLPQHYPIELEKQLNSAIVSGDGAAAREYLNRFLGEIFFQTNGDLAVIRARATDLLVLLSHAAIEGGADAPLIFDLTSGYREELERFDSLEKMSIWLGGVLNRFISYVFEFGDVQHQDSLHKIVRYIKENYMNKITLDDIAEHVFMSKYYISRIFNEKMGMSVSAFINKMRIDRSKRLLAETTLSIAAIANMTGFDDQSYFAKQFRSATGVSPGKFRETQGSTQ